VQYGVAMPMRSMNIVFIAKADHVPANTIAPMHNKATQTAIEQAVDGVLLIALFEFLVVLRDAVRFTSKFLDVGVEVRAQILVEDHE